MREGEGELEQRARQLIKKRPHVGCDVVEEEGVGEGVGREQAERAEQAEEEREVLVGGRVPMPAKAASRYGQLGRRGYPARRRRRCGGAAAWGSHTLGTIASIVCSGNRTASLASPRRSTHPPAEQWLPLEVQAVVREAAQQPTGAGDDEDVADDDGVDRAQHVHRHPGPRRSSCPQVRTHRRRPAPAWPPPAPTAGHDCPPPSMSLRRQRTRRRTCRRRC